MYKLAHASCISIRRSHLLLGLKKIDEVTSSSNGFTTQHKTQQGTRKGWKRIHGERTKKRFWCTCYTGAGGEKERERERNKWSSYRCFVTDLPFCRVIEVTNESTPLIFRLDKDLHIIPVESLSTYCSSDFSLFYNDYEQINWKHVHPACVRFSPIDVIDQLEQQRWIKTECWRTKN